MIPEAVPVIHVRMEELFPDLNDFGAEHFDTILINRDRDITEFTHLLEAICK
jgi:hypothetical protein